MIRRQLTTGMGLIAGCGLLLVIGCGDNPPVEQASAKPAARSDAAAPTPGQAEGWGTIRGRVVFAGDQLPERVQLKVDKDTEHCLSKGPLFSEQWVINPQNRGIRYAVVFLKAGRGKTLPVHESLKQAPGGDVVLDQPICAYEPHVLAVRAGQRLVAKNPAPVSHNVMLSGLRNLANVQIPPGKEHAFSLEPEGAPVKVSCSAHTWMSGALWVFDHPYFAVTDPDGNFEIKLAPGGAQNLVLWQEAVSFVPDAKGRTVEIKPDGVLDLGEIAIKP